VTRRAGRRRSPGLWSDVAAGQQSGHGIHRQHPILARAGGLPPFRYGAGRMPAPAYDEDPSMSPLYPEPFLAVMTTAGTEAEKGRPGMDGRCRRWRDVLTTEEQDELQETA
jgi:hypothetical protein